MVADRGFGEPDRFGQLATVDFAGLRTEQYGHDLDPDGVSEGFEPKGHLEGVIVGHGSGCHRRTAHRG